MTRQEELVQAARKEYPEWEEAQCHFIDGAHYADSHPHWISVEDELPMEYEPVLAAFGNHYARVCFYSGGKWYIDAGDICDEVFGVSHWMQISPPPKEGGEE